MFTSLFFLHTQGPDISVTPNSSDGYFLLSHTQVSQIKFRTAARLRAEWQQFSQRCAALTAASKSKQSTVFDLYGV